jgi:hypothetical protein
LRAPDRDRFPMMKHGACPMNSARFAGSTSSNVLLQGAHETAMRTFLTTHWKSIVALVILVLLAVLTMSPGAAETDFSARLRQHVTAIASSEHNTANPAALDDTSGKLDYPSLARGVRGLAHTIGALAGTSAS